MAKMTCRVRNIGFIIPSLEMRMAMMDSDGFVRVLRVVDVAKLD
jgi:hypothetical protein